MHNVNLDSRYRQRGLALRPRRKFQPNRTALLVVDMQNGFIEPGYPLMALNGHDIIASIETLAGHLRAAGGIVAIIQHSTAAAGRLDLTSVPASAGESATQSSYLVPGDPSFEIHPALSIASGDMRVVKNTPGVFHPNSNSGLLEQLLDRGIHTLIITGVMTDCCCEAAARDGFQHGFDILFVDDATSAASDEEHNAALIGLANWFVEVVSTSDVLDRIALGYPQ